MAMAILMPLTLYFDFLTSILFLTAIFTGGGFGCAIPAILMNIPGTSAAVATTFDGYPMARNGRHNEALGLALGASAAGTAFGYIVLFLLVEPVSQLVLKLGPLEMLVVAIWGLTLIAALNDGNMVKGLMAGLFGLLIGTVGMNPAGYVRGTFDIATLLDGVPVIPAMMGLFVASQIFGSIGKSKYIVEDKAARRISLSAIVSGMWQVFKYPKVLFRGSVIGVVIGSIPGVGSSVANLLSYFETRRGDADPQSFGKGNPKGVIAAGSANSSSEGGSMAILLALGIPGGGATAILLSAFSMHNVTGGPRFMAEQQDIVYAIILGNFAQCFLLVVIGLPFILWASSAVKVPMNVLAPSVLVLASLGAFAITGNQSGPLFLFGFAVLGWVMTLYGFPVAATVVGLVLGRMTEGEMLRSYQISGGDLSYILERPFALALFVLLVFSLLSPLIFRKSRARRAGVPPISVSE